MANPIGIDLSHWNSDAPNLPVHWPDVKDAGISFAFLKATEGSTFVDNSFDRNSRLAADQGVLWAPYHFWRWSVSPEKQADHFFKVAGESPLPPVVDIEDMSVASGANVLPLLLPFLAAVEGRFDRPPIFYTFPYYLIERGNPNLAALAKLRLWIAHYTTAAQPMLPAAWTHWTFWQHTSKGTVSGITSRVDLNRFNGSLAELHLLAGQQPPEQPPAPKIELIVPPGTQVKVTERGL